MNRLDYWTMVVFGVLIVYHLRQICHNQIGQAKLIDAIAIKFFKEKS